MPIAALAVSFGAFASALLGGWLALRAVRYVGGDHRGRCRHPDRGGILRPHPGVDRAHRLHRYGDGR